MTRALQIGVPAAFSSIIIVLRRSTAQSVGKEDSKTLREVLRSTIAWLSTTRRWQMRHSVSHVRLYREFLESGGNLDLLALSTAIPLRAVANALSLGE